MPARPPDDIKDDREYKLWRDLTRTFEEFCGEVESEWPERKRKFLEIADRVVEPLRVGDHLITCACLRVTSDGRWTSYPSLCDCKQPSTQQ